MWELLLNEIIINNILLLHTYIDGKMNELWSWSIVKEFIGCKEEEKSSLHYVIWEEVDKTIKENN